MIERRSLVLLILALLLAGPAFAASADADVVAAVAEVDGMWVEARQANDWDTVDRLTAADFVSLPDDGNALTRDEWFAWVKTHPIRLTRETVHVRVYAGGRTAVVTMLESGTLETDHGPREFKANTSRVWVKDGDDWKLVSLHFSWLSP